RGGRRDRPETAASLVFEDRAGFVGVHQAAESSKQPCSARVEQRRLEVERQPPVLHIRPRAPTLRLRDAARDVQTDLAPGTGARTTGLEELLRVPGGELGPLTPDGEVQPV